MATSKKPNLNLAFFLAIASVVFCWLFGLPSLAAGIFSLRSLIMLRKGKKPNTKTFAGFKLKWGYLFAWSGIVFSVVFTVYYVLALISGAFVKL